MSALAGVAALAATLVAGESASVSALAAWDVAALVFLAWVWSSVAPKDAAATAASAQSEVPSRTEGEAIFVGAGTASLIAVAFTLAEAGRESGAVRALLIALAVGSVVLAGASVHTVYALRYARLYYGAPRGGIDFNDDEPPRYLDFAYVALTVGMTSQVSDTPLTATRLRRTAIRHALLFVSLRHGRRGPDNQHRRGPARAVSQPLGRRVELNDSTRVDAERQGNATSRAFGA